MSEEPAGVFVRLPLSVEQVESVLNSYTGDKESTNICMQKTILDLGTPVTGGTLDVIGYADSKEIDSFAPSADINPCAVIFAEEITSHSIPLVRQSDAQAQIAALGAEVVRLRSCLEGILPRASTACHRSLNGRESHLLAGYCADAREALKGGAS